jgi:RNA 3'-terminal phosphate cyclase (ATP)
MTNPQLITIDGSQGEGGGQVLRSAVGLAVVTGKAVRIEKIRAGRSKPGLMRQHLTAMKAATQICNGVLTGAALGSTELTFEPQQVVPGKYQFSIGTAGSATLVLQTILPALLTASGPSEIILEGGTHNQWAPPFDFLQRAYLPVVNRMGAHVEATLERHGFFPAGGGRFVVKITPAKSLTGFDLLERGATVSKSAKILISNLPLNIAEREAKKIVQKLSFQQQDVTIEPVESSGPGNIVMAEIQFENVTELATAFGRVGASAEHVADEAVKQIRRYLTHSAPVGEYLADQILLPLGLSAAQPASAGTQRGGSFRTLPLSRHSLTHIDILQTMLPVSIVTQGNDEDCLVTIKPH